MGKQMEGDNRQRRKQSKKSRDAGKEPSATGATQSASQQRTEASKKMTHQERIDLQREGKHEVITENTPEARPGSRDRDTEDRESHPRR